MSTNEQKRLLLEALHWATVTRDSARSRYASLSAQAQGSAAVDDEKLQIAGQNLALAQQTVDEIQAKLSPAAPGHLR